MQDVWANRFPLLEVMILYDLPGFKSWTCRNLCVFYSEDNFSHFTCSLSTKSCQPIPTPVRAPITDPGKMLPSRPTKRKHIMQGMLSLLHTTPENNTLNISILIDQIYIYFNIFN
jgi:hypothetical protein